MLVSKLTTTVGEAAISLGRACFGDTERVDGAHAPTDGVLCASLPRRPTNDADVTFSGDDAVARAIDPASLARQGQRLLEAHGLA